MLTLSAYQAHHQQMRYDTCIGTCVFHRMSGAHAFKIFIFYAVPIFRASFIGIDPYGAAVVMAFVQLLASITSGLLVDTIGRLLLLIASNLFMTLALAAFGTFIYMEAGSLANPAALIAGQASQLVWIPLVCVFFCLRNPLGGGTRDRLHIFTLLIIVWPLPTRSPPPPLDPCWSEH